MTSYNHMWGKCRAADKVMALVNGFPGDKGNLRNLMVLQAYFDESGDSHATGQTTLVLAGYIATAENWAKFCNDWQSLLNATNRSCFKMKSMADSECEKYYRIIERYISASVFCVVDVKDLVQAVDLFQFPNIFLDLEKIKRQLKNPYYLAFKNIFLRLIQNQEILGLNEPIDMIFDERTERRSILDGHDFLIFSAPESFNNKLGNHPMFQRDHENPQLQAADLYAGYLRKAYLHGADLKSGHPFPWVVNKGIPTMHIHLDYEHFVYELSHSMGSENIIKLHEYEEDPV